MQISKEDFKRIVSQASDALDVSMHHGQRADAAGELADHAICLLVSMRDSFGDPKNVGSMEQFARDSVRLAAAMLPSGMGITDLIAEANKVVKEAEE